MPSRTFRKSCLKGMEMSDGSNYDSLSTSKALKFPKHFHIHHFVYSSEHGCEPILEMNK